MASRTPFFVKVLEQSAYAKSLMGGQIYANPLAHFRNIENVARSDEYEGAFLLDTPDMRMSLWPTDPVIRSQLGDVNLRRQDLAGPLALFPNNYKRFNVFSMYAKTVDDGDFPNTGTDHLHELKKLFEVPASLTKFGKHAVVIHKPGVFVERVKDAAISAGYDFRCGTVEYANPRDGWGTLDPFDPKGIFRKRESYAVESEYRLVFGRPLYNDAPITLQIGDISDIAYPADVSTINNGIEVRIREDN